MLYHLVKFMTHIRLPEPKEDVDFLIENIERQDAQSVVSFDCSWSSVLVESTFRYFWEDRVHRVNSSAKVLLRKRQNSRAVCRKFVAKESVDEWAWLDKRA